MAKETSHLNKKADIPEDATIYPPPITKVKPKREWAASKRIHQAGTITNDWTYNQAPYKTGDGDTIQPRRKNSDHSRFKSHGYRT